jgi:hypothetical protein
MKALKTSQFKEMKTAPLDPGSMGSWDMSNVLEASDSTDVTPYRRHESFPDPTPAASRCRELRPQGVLLA